MNRSGSIPSELLDTQRCQKQSRPVLHISDKVTQSHIAIGKTWQAQGKPCLVEINTPLIPRLKKTVCLINKMALQTSKAALSS